MLLVTLIIFKNNYIIKLDIRNYIYLLLGIIELNNEI